MKKLLLIGVPLILMMSCSSSYQQYYHLWQSRQFSSFSYNYRCNKSSDPIACLPVRIVVVHNAIYEIELRNDEFLDIDDDPVIKAAVRFSGERVLLKDEYFSRFLSIDDMFIFLDKEKPLYSKQKASFSQQYGYPEYVFIDWSLFKTDDSVQYYVDSFVVTE